MEGEEMKKSVMIGIALVFAFVAVFIIMESEDSDAAIKKESGGNVGNAYVKAVKYDLCYNDNPNDPNYGDIQYLAFVTGGGDTFNPSSLAPVCEIVPTISANGHTYTVVGIRNNAFQATKGDASEGGGCRLHLEKVIIPETLQYIGVNGNYEPENNYTSCFSECEKLTYLEIKGENPQLKQIGGNSFNKTNLRELDLSHCKNLTGMLIHAFRNCDSLVFLDIRHVRTIGSNAFQYVTNLEDIVMPMKFDGEPDPDIAPNAFPGMTFTDQDGHPITGNDLVGKCFKKVGDEMKLGYVATFNSNGGVHLDEFVYLVGETLPTTTHEGYKFYKWRNTDPDYSSEMFLTMPNKNVDLIAVWEIEKPTSVTLTYNGYEQTAYHDTHAYTVNGSSHKNVGSYEATFTLKDENFMWVDETSDPVVVSWNIGKKLLTATYHGENVKPGATPLLKVEVTGFVGGDTPQTAAGYVSPFISDKDLPTDMGKYTLTPIGGAADNYEFEYVGGTLHNNFGLEESEYVLVGTVALVVLMSLYMLFTHTLAGKKY